MPIKKKKEDISDVVPIDTHPVFNDSFEDISDSMTDEEIRDKAPRESEEKGLIYRDENGTIYDLTETLSSLEEEDRKERVRKRYHIENEPDVIEIPKDDGSEMDENEPLTEQEELFCQYYIKNRATRFNATQSYALAYWHDIEWADTTTITDRVTWKMVKKSTKERLENMCGACWARKLRKAKIQKRNSELLIELKNDTVVDWKMIEHILWEDSQASRDMIKEYNKVMWRVTNKNKDESESDKAKAELFTEMKDKVKVMESRELIDSIQELLTKK